jgi:hypothetical protein
MLLARAIQFFAGRKTRTLLSLTMALALLVMTSRSSYAQFVPCRIVTLNVVPPPVVQAGQPFQLTTNLTVSCDPSVLPVVRVDLVDATSSTTLSSNSVPYYPSLSSFTASVVSQATARQLTGSWALRLQAYIISGINGQVVASTAQLFQINVEPYTSPLTETQTTEMTTQVSNTSIETPTQISPAVTEPENTTKWTISSKLAVNNQSTTGQSNELLVPAAILLVGFLAFGALMLGANKRKQSPGRRCVKCGMQLNHKERYCPSCGVEQAK